VGARGIGGGPPWEGIAAFQFVGGFLIALTTFLILNGGPSWFGFLVYGALICAVVFAGSPVLCAFLAMALARARSPRERRRAVLIGAAFGSVTAGMIGNLVVLGYPPIVSAALAASGFVWTVVPLLIAAGRSDRVRAVPRDSLN
jgi:predicted permease